MTTTTLKTADLTGEALDWAVANSARPPSVDALTPKNYKWFSNGPGADSCWSPSANWEQGGHLIEKYGVEIGKGYRSGPFIATTQNIVHAIEIGGIGRQEGPTHLIAAMRAIVAAELGDTVDVPVELIQ